VVLTLLSGNYRATCPGRLGLASWMTTGVDSAGTTRGSSAILRAGHRHPGVRQKSSGSITIPAARGPVR